LINFSGIFQPENVNARASERGGYFLIFILHPFFY
jgi:hypothetical protein